MYRIFLAHLLKKSDRFFVASFLYSIVLDNKVILFAERKILSVKLKGFIVYYVTLCCYYFEALKRGVLIDMC